jgi:hypothetical protein
MGCADPGFRGEEAVNNLKEFLNGIIPLRGNPYVINYPGVTHKLINFSRQTSEELWRDILDFTEGTGINTVIIYHHEDCKAYKKNFGILSPKMQEKKILRICARQKKF